MSDLATIAWIKRILNEISATSLFLPSDSCVVFRSQDISRGKKHIQRRDLVIGAAKANGISRALFAVFVCAFKSALIAEVA